MKTVLRIAKIKASGIAGSNAHNNRLIDCPNADPMREEKNRILVGSNDLMGDFKGRLAEACGKDYKYRKDATLTTEMILTASPAFFEGFPDKLDDWVEKNIEFVKEKYGAENVIQAILHLDEKTPHLHVHIANLTREKKPRLNQKAVFGGPAELSKLQTEYALKMESFGLKRGVERYISKENRKTHVEQSEYDREVKKALVATTEKVTVLKPVIQKEDKSFSGFYSTDEVLNLMRQHGHSVLRAHMEKFTKKPAVIANELLIERKKTDRLEIDYAKSKESNRLFYRELCKSKQEVNDLDKSLKEAKSLISKASEEEKGRIKREGEGKVVVIPFKPNLVLSKPILSPSKPS